MSIARELAQFRVAYRSVHSLVDIADLTLKPKLHDRRCAVASMTTMLTMTTKMTKNSKTLQSVNVNSCIGPTMVI